MTQYLEEASWNAAVSNFLCVMLWRNFDQLFRTTLLEVVKVCGRLCTPH